MNEIKQLRAEFDALWAELPKARLGGISLFADANKTARLDAINKRLKQLERVQGMQHKTTIKAHKP